MSAERLEPGKFYHIFNRGINRTKIFMEEENYKFFMKRFVKYLDDKVDVYAYTLMPTHFHFFVEVLAEIHSEDLSEAFGDSLSADDKHQATEVFDPFLLDPTPTPRQLTPVEKAFKDFFISYAKAFNKRYDRTGSLFQHKFKRKKVASESYFGTVIAYIHLNPVEARLCRHPSEWKYSSYNAIISNHPTRVKREEVLEWFDGKKEFIDFHEAYQDYQDYKNVEAYLFGERSRRQR
jgi:REP element-mobilizing transposase RayT